MQKPNNIDDYLSTFPEAIRERLEAVRQTIKKAAPNATEVISYGMPAFRQRGVLVYFAGYKEHIGFYPTPSGIAAFQEELAGYKAAKGSVQFPLNEPTPLDLISRIVQFRVEEDARQAAAKKKQS